MFPSFLETCDDSFTLFFWMRFPFLGMEAWKWRATTTLHDACHIKWKLLVFNKCCCEVIITGLIHPRLSKLGIIFMSEPIVIDKVPTWHHKNVTTFVIYLPKGGDKSASQLESGPLSNTLTSQQTADRLPEVTMHNVDQGRLQGKKN